MEKVFRGGFDAGARIFFPKGKKGIRPMIKQFRDAIRSAGVEPPEVIAADGKLRRFPSNDNRGDDAGWYALHGDDASAESFGDRRDSIWELDGFKSSAELLDLCFSPCCCCIPMRDC